MTERDKHHRNDDHDGSDEIADWIRRAGPRPAVPEDVIARLESAARAAWRVKVRSGSNRRGGWAFAAAAAAAIVVIGLGLWAARQDVPGTDPAAAMARIQTVVGEASMRMDPGTGEARPLVDGATVAAGSTLITAESAKLAVSMPTGHSVRMDSGSRIRLVTRSSVELGSGAVYVDSGAFAPREPLVVLTPLGEIRDVGTQFEARLQGDSLRIRVREGTVHLIGARSRFEVAAGRELSVAADGTVARRDAQGHGPAWDWTTEVAPTFEVDGRPLREFLEWMARERGWALKFAEPDAADHASTIRLSGSIAGLTLDEGLDAVLATCNLTHGVENGVLTVEANRP